jgi:hypothetical protein
MTNQITGGDVMTYLLPDGGWSIHGEDFSTVIFDEGAKTITEAEFKAGFDTYASWKSQQDASKAEAKAALLERLGITEAEAKLLLG